MAQVTGLTAAKMLELAGENIIDANVVGQNLILTTRDGDDIDAGMVIGPVGPAGVPDMSTMAQLVAAIWELEAKTIASDNGFTNWHGDAFVPVMNRIASRTLDAFGFPRLGIYRDMDRDQGFMGLDDYVALSSYKGLVSTGLVGSFSAGSGMVVSPDKKWLIVAGSSTAIRVHPIDTNGVVSSTPVSTSVAATAANMVGGSITISPDGKTIFVGIQSSPYIEARPFNTATGAVGAKWADPATLPTGPVNAVAISPNSLFVILGVSAAAAASAVQAIAVNTTTGVFGASTFPAAAPSNVNQLGMCITEAGDYVLGNNIGNTLHAWAFNQTTGVFGAKTDAVGVTSLNQGPVRYANGKVVGYASSTPYIHGWNFAAGVWGAKWANPAALPAGNIQTLQCELTADGTAFLFYDQGIGIAAYPISAAGGFGAKFTPAGTPLLSPPTGVARFPMESRGDLLAFNATVGGTLLFGDKAGTDQLTGQAESTTKALLSPMTTVYILDDFVKNHANVTRQYDISTNGGSSWTNNVPVGVVTSVPSGSNLRIRVTITRTALTQNGFINWFTVWGG